MSTVLVKVKETFFFNRV